MAAAGRGHQTQWAALFAVASELCKRGYEVAFTSGQTTPLADLMVVSPKRKQMFLVDVKGHPAKIVMATTHSLTILLAARDSARSTPVCHVSAARDQALMRMQRQPVEVLLAPLDVEF